MGAELENASDDYVLLALQGPKSADLLSELTDTAIQQIPFYAFEHGEVCGVPSLISATGYTGEKGFELYINANKYDAAIINIIITLSFIETLTIFQIFFG